MPPMPQNLHAFVGAAVLGIVGAAGMFLVEHFRHERQRHKMANDLARLDREMAVLKKELDQVMSKQRESNSKAEKKVKRSKAKSIVSVSTEDYLSTNEIDSSDMEFYDVSDEDEDTLTEALSEELTSLDVKLKDCSLETGKICLQRLQDLSLEHPENPELLWRIGQAHYRIYEKLDVNDEENRKDNIFKGVEACEQSLKLNYENGVAHKWLAILLGVKGDFLPLKERIQISYDFKKHVEIALKYLPSDGTLHHMLGRLAYELASLKWYERKVAAALFGEPPNATYEQALDHFLAAERLHPTEWKTNKMYIGKTKIALGDYKDAVDWLDKANAIRMDSELSAEEMKNEEEMKTLLEQYKSYR